MSDQLSQRCVLVMLAAMSMALALGLVAWGPVSLLPQDHRHADSTSPFGLLPLLNVAVSLPTLVAGVCGWRALRRSPWPASLRHPWMCSFGFVTLSSLLAAVYHLAPGDLTYVLASITVAGGSLLLLCGFLAERVDPLFGSPRACAIAVLLVALAGLICCVNLASGKVDVRPLLMLHILPVLLIPAGALSLQGSHTRRSDWLLMLGTYLASRMADAFDVQLLHATGWVNGHALMHVGLTVTIGWLAWRAYADARTDTSERAATPADDGFSHASTSFNTTA